MLFPTRVPAFSAREKWSKHFILRKETHQPSSDRPSQQVRVGVVVDGGGGGGALLERCCVSFIFYVVVVVVLNDLNER